MLLLYYYLKFRLGNSEQFHLPSSTSPSGSFSDISQHDSTHGVKHETQMAC